MKLHPNRKAWPCHVVVGHTSAGPPGLDVVVLYAAAAATAALFDRSTAAAAAAVVLMLLQLLCQWQIDWV